MREQIQHLLRQKGGVLPYGQLKIRYRHEQPWGVPCTLDVFAEKPWRDASKKEQMLEQLPANYEEIAANLSRILQELISPSSGIILAAGAQGISFLWRETVEEKVTHAAAKGEQHGDLD